MKSAAKLDSKDLMELAGINKITLAQLLLLRASAEWRRTVCQQVDNVHTSQDMHMLKAMAAPVLLATTVYLQPHLMENQAIAEDSPSSKCVMLHQHPNCTLQNSPIIRF